MEGKRTQARQAIEAIEAAIANLREARANLPLGLLRNATEGVERVLETLHLALTSGGEGETPEELYIERSLRGIEDVPDALRLLVGVLAALPGGERAEELVRLNLGEEPPGVGWREVATLGAILVSLGDAGDVRRFSQALFPSDL